MLRTLMQEPELIRLCHSKSWSDVYKRSRSHPIEAQPTSASLRGEGSTALAAAIRAGAPLHVLRALLNANSHQIGITHRNRGSVLHEALRHQVPDDIFDFLLRAVVDYQKSSILIPSKNENFIHDQYGEAQFQYIGIQENRLLSSSNLFGVQDDIGRTALHLLVDRAKRLLGNHKRSEITWDFFQTLLRAYIDSAITMDSDGYTPLVLLLMTPKGARLGQCEDHIFRMVDLILSLCPQAAVATRKLPRAWRFHPLSINSTHSTIHGEGSPTPIYFALLYGRSLGTIRRIIQAANKLGSNSVCSNLVSPYHEVSLHIAVTAHVPLSILYHVVLDYPQAVLKQDMYGLTPLDWLWIRYMLDVHASRDPVPPPDGTRVASRRRFVPNDVRDWKGIDGVSTSKNINPVAVRGLQDDFLQRIKLLLPVAAAAWTSRTKSGATFNNEPWSLLHAACAVHCSLTIVQAALTVDEASSQTRDARAGRLPLHYAAARAGYQASIPVGVSRKVEYIRERSAVFVIVSVFPDACRIRDEAGQLPVHIAIDTAKRYPIDASQSVDQNETQVHLEILECLITEFPGALDCRDGKTGLYPWQQAAVGPGANLTLIYALLRIHPGIL